MCYVISCKQKPGKECSSAGVEPPTVKCFSIPGKKPQTNKETAINKRKGFVSDLQVSQT